MVNVEALMPNYGAIVVHRPDVLCSSKGCTHKTVSHGSTTAVPICRPTP